MSIRKSESFVRGAFMLSLAALVSRLLGAFYRPIVTRIFAPFDGKNGAVGIGLTQVPLSVYGVIFSFTSVGLNVGISRLVAERVALGDLKGAQRVFRLSMTVMTALGLLSGLGLWFGAPWIAGLVSEEVIDTIPGFRATAPALFFASIMAAYRGLFQGLQLMTPSAYSQIIEQVVRVGSGILLTYFFVHRSVALGAAGFNFGDVVGAVAGLGYLWYLARSTGAGLWRVSEEAASLEPPAYRASRETAWQLIRRIFAVAGPIAIVGALVPLMMLADTFFVFRSLASIGIHGPEAQAQYGLLSNAFTLIYLPTIFTSAIYTSILPAITEAIALGQRKRVRERATQAYRMTTLLAIPSQAGIFGLAAGIYGLIYGDVAGGPVLAAMSWAILWIMLQQTTAGVLQGAGKIGLSVRNSLVTALVKIALTAWWTPILGVRGAAYATAAGFLVGASLNLYHVERLMGRTLNFNTMLFKPTIAALAMVASIIGLQHLFGLAPGASSLTTLALIGAGGGVYGLILLLIRGIARAELEFVPKVGRPLAALLTRYRLLR